MTTALGHRATTIADSTTLAQMNQQLIEDERHCDRMTTAELEMRRQSLLEGGHTATLFDLIGQIVGYALWREEPASIHLRHFFFARGFRRCGVRRQTVALLRDRVWPANARARVNVLTGSQPALDF